MHGESSDLISSDFNTFYALAVEESNAVRYMLIVVCNDPFTKPFRFDGLLFEANKQPLESYC